MYDSTVGKPRKADVRKIVNEMSIAFEIDIDFGDIVKIWNIILKSNGIDLNHLEGWEQEENMPHFDTKPQSFEYESEFHFHDDSTYYVFSDNLNMKLSFAEFKQKVINYFEWNSITQS
jgi:hypothetical protein